MFFDNKFLRTLEKVELVVKKTMNTGLQGHHVSHNPGGGLEFKEHREYQPGDDYRYIDWNLYSRLGQLFLKQFTEEREIIVYFLIDKSDSMTFGQSSKFTYAVKSAAALGYIALTQLDRIGVSFFDESLAESFKPGKGKNRVHQFFDFLSRVESGGKTNLNQAINEFSYRYKKPGLAVILSDFLDEKGYQQGLKRLKENNWNVFVIQTLTKNEVDPNFEGEVLLIDTETNEGKELEINQQTLDNYRQNLNKFCEQLKKFSQKYGIKYFQVLSESKIEDLIFETLYKEEGVR